MLKIYGMTMAVSILALATTLRAEDDSQYKVRLAPSGKAESASARAEWFSKARFGMFIHWGLYSELAGSYNGLTMPTKQVPHGNSWYSEWIQMRLDVPRDVYRNLARKFNPTEFNAYELVREARLAGMRYIVITSKHHDGFALWDSKVSDYDLGITPCKRDLLGELVRECRKQGLRVGFYYSHWQDWDYPGGALPPWPDKKQPTDAEFEKYWQDKCLPQVQELLQRYHPDLLWFDTWGGVARRHITVKRRDELIDLIRAECPDCLINGRIAAHNPGPRVDFLSAGDNQHPEKNLGCPWQTPGTMCRSWAWHAHDFGWKSRGVLIRLLATNASLGGNYLLNIGPYASGAIPSPAIRRLRELGGWLAANGEAIYGTQPLDDVPPTKWGRLTARTLNDGTRVVYAMVMNKSKVLDLPPALGAVKEASVLETGEPVKLLKDGRAFALPRGALDPDVAVFKLIMQ